MSSLAGYFLSRNTALAMDESNGGGISLAWFSGRHALEASWFSFVAFDASLSMKRRRAKLDCPSQGLTVEAAVNIPAGRWYQHPYYLGIHLQVKFVTRLTMLCTLFWFSSSDGCSRSRYPLFALYRVCCDAASLP